MAMNNSGASFSVATTVFVSLAICAVISYGVFYYFKQRISVIEQSQMEQARIMQSFIARSIMHQQHQQHPHPHPHPPPRQDGNQQFQEHLVHKEVTNTESGLIEVSSDSESESSDSDSESESESESTTSESSSDCDNESRSGSGSGSGSEHRRETKRIQIQIQSLPDAEVTDVIVDDDDKPESSTKKIISLNKPALGDNESDDDDDDDNDDGESESGSSEHHPDPDQSLEPFELNIGYKTKPPASKIHLNYGNMSVSALRQLAKERGLGGDDGDLQKLKKKDIVQLLQ